ASKEIMQQAAPDNPNPDVGDQMSDVGDQRSEDAPATSDIRPLSSEEAQPLQRVTAFDRGRADIAARFREKRAAQGDHTDYHGDHRDLTQTYGTVGLPPDRMSDDRGQMSDDRDRRSDDGEQTSDIRHLTSDISGQSPET